MGSVDGFGQQGVDVTEGESVHVLANQDAVEKSAMNEPHALKGFRAISGDENGVFVLL